MRCAAKNCVVSEGIHRDADYFFAVRESVIGREQRGTRGDAGERGELRLTLVGCRSVGFNFRPLKGKPNFLAYFCERLPSLSSKSLTKML